MSALDRLRILKRRADWRLGRWTAKLAIAACLCLPPDSRAVAAIELRPALSGAPRAFVNGQPAEWSLSLSHSDGIGSCVVASAGAELGCDIEKVEPHSQAFLTDYFTAGEQTIVTRGLTLQRDSVLTLLWSAKESALKSLQCGIRVDTRFVSVDPAGLPAFPAGTWSHLVATCSGGRTLQGWWRQTGDLVRTVVAAPPPLPPTAFRASAAETMHEQV